ncbi:hypothetical protein GCM10025873_13690 [Demequina sediminis]|nr:hypothetical protein [Demequina sediminis]BDZ61578.1 hypothetical protein GCM10025873_13690 [Demequina sediminis]
MAREHAPGLGEPEAAGSAQRNRGAEPTLESAQLLARGGLRHAHGAGGGGERALVVDRDQQG